MGSLLFYGGVVVVLWCGGGVVVWRCGGVVSAIATTTFTITVSVTVTAIEGLHHGRWLPCNFFLTIRLLSM